MLFGRKRRKNVGGSTQAAKYSYARGESQTPVTQNSEHKGRGVIHKIFRFLLTLAILTSFIYISTLNGNFALKTFGSTDDSATILRSNDEYNEYIKQLLRGSPLNRSKFTINTNSIEQKILEKFPELEEASIAVPIFTRSPVVSLTADELSVLLLTQNQVFALNSKGYVVADAKAIPRITGLGLPLVVDQAGAEVEKNKQALPTHQTQYFTEVKRQLKAANISIERIFLTGAAREFNIKITDKNYLIKFSFDTDARQSAGAFLALKQRLESNNTPVNEYIDVRLGEKVFYK